MLVAMAITAALCIAIGSFPSLLYSLLPYPVDFVPYSLDHVVGQTQLLFLSALAFTVLMRTGIYPPELRSVNLDTDWLYRRLGPMLLRGTGAVIAMAANATRSAVARCSGWMAGFVLRHHESDGILARTLTTGGMAMWLALLLAAYLLVYYV